MGRVMGRELSAVGGSVPCLWSGGSLPCVRADQDRPHHERIEDPAFRRAVDLLDAGAKADVAAVESTLGLVGSGRVPRECGVQAPLIDLLCDHGADPNHGMLAALVHAEFAAVDALLRRGATLDLTVAAATG